MTNKHLFAGTLLIAAVALGAYILHDESAPSEESASSVLPLGKESSVPAAVTKSNGVERENPVVSPPIIQYVDPIKPDTSLHGENASIYRAYDNTTLEALAEGGDLMAIKVLAHQLVSNPPSEESFEGLEMEEGRELLEEYKQKKRKYLELSLIYGDLGLLDSVGTVYASGYDFRDPAQARNAVLEELALLEFAAMRGRQSKKYVEAPYVVKEYSEYLDDPLVLTEFDKNHIRERAQAIYDGYETQREELGLGPFEDIEEDYSHIHGYQPTQEYEEAMGKNAF